MNRPVSTVTFVLAASMAIGCIDATPLTRAVVRTDSAGIEIVRSEGPDRSYDFPPRSESYLQDTDGTPYIFSGTTPQWVRTSRAAETFVIVTDKRAVARFDSLGRFSRLIGKHGRGPGEFLAPLMMMLYEDTIAVSDGFKRSLLRWSHFGDSLIAQITWPEDARVGRVYAVRGGDALSSSEGERAGAPVGTLGWSSDSAPLITFPSPEVVLVTVPCRPGPLERAAYFAPRFHVATAGSFTVTAGTARYEVWLLDEDGIARSIRRSYEERPPRASEVKLAAGSGFRTTMANGARCSVSARELIDSVGVAEVYPAIHGLSVTRDGSIWVSRTFTRNEIGDVDQFAPDGSYLRTWRNAPLPLASLPDGRLIVPREDEYSGGTLLELVRLPDA